MADNPFADLIPEKNPFADLVPDPNAGIFADRETPQGQFNDPRGALLPIVSGAAALPVSGLAGLGGLATGFIGGLGPWW